MSIIGSITSKDALTSDKPSLTPEQVVEQLRAIQEQIPATMLPQDDLKQIRREASVNQDFAREAINVVGASEIVQAAVGNTLGEVQQAEGELARWSTVESELRAMLRTVAVANLVRRHRIGRVALQAYNVSKQLVREESHADLLPRVEAMSRIRKFGRRRSKAAAESKPPQSTQQPPQQQSPPPKAS